MPAVVVALGSQVSKQNGNNGRPSTTLLIPLGLSTAVPPGQLGQIFHPIVFGDDTECATTPFFTSHLDFTSQEDETIGSRWERWALIRRRTQSAYPAVAPLIRAGLFSGLESVNSPMPMSQLENIDRRLSYHIHHLEPQTVTKIEDEGLGHGGNVDVTNPSGLKGRPEKPED
ncbi:hypothetical protein FRB99_002227 [Tulasnella sp. 403]|nr:hypothetical protein FRB99_002227 [Tulasnella sp. 403]